MEFDRRTFLSTVAGGGTLMAGGGMSAHLDSADPGWTAPFPALRQRANDRPLTYLDSAATTLRPQSVIDALVDFYSTDNANPSPVHTLASRAGQRLSAARQAVARFINAASPGEIVFVRGTTEGVNLIASTWAAENLRKGDEIVLTIAEHNSNLMPWTRAARNAGAIVRVLDVDDEGRPRLDEFARILSPRTRLVAFSHVSNVLGFVNPAKELCALAHQAGATVVIDGAQAAPHVRIDVQDLGCDFYVFSGHKMLGPMATGVVWGRQRLLDAMPPYHVGSNMAHEVDFERAAFEHGALKFQAGTPDVAGPVGLAAAVELLDRLGRDALWKHDQDLVRHGLSRLAAVPRLRLIGPKSAENRIPVFTFVIDGQSPAALAKALDQQGIAIRAGDMAALPLLRRFAASEAARASAYLYSTTGDIDRLADALASIG
jgi:cysteine desulfurase/selenocysteine lyase